MLSEFHEDGLQFLIWSGFLVLLIGGGILGGVRLVTDAKEHNLRKCESAFTAAVVSQLDLGARNELKWITSLDTPADVLNRPECKQAKPNK